MYPTPHRSGIWAGCRVVITGGASFIGSHLATVLHRSGARVVIVDDLSRGVLSNLAPLLELHALEFHQLDVREEGRLRAVLSGADVVFHLAARHGGRWFVERRHVATAENFGIDAAVFRSTARERVGRVIFASSACVYPTSLQSSAAPHCLVEGDVGPPYEPDGIYGLAKLAGEVALRAYVEEGTFAGVSCRLFTVYGPRATEDHAIIALMAKLLLRDGPLVIWGDGEQVRTWVYVDDAVRGLVTAAERIGDGSAVNIGTDEAYSLRDAALLIMRVLNRRRAITFDPRMPTGPRRRVPALDLARAALGWAPDVPLVSGLERTADWFIRERLPVVTPERLNDLLVGATQ